MNKIIWWEHYLTCSNCDASVTYTLKHDLVITWAHATCANCADPLNLISINPAPKAGA